MGFWDCRSIARFAARGAWPGCRSGAAGGIIGAAVALLLRPSLRGELFSIPVPAWAGALVGLVTAEVFVRLYSVTAASARRMRAPLSNRRAYPRRAAARRRRRAAAALSWRASLGFV